MNKNAYATVDLTAHCNAQVGIKRKRSRSLLQAICLGFLLLYPLRHIHLGVDLWDGGYNYANFQYAGLEHMDSMWYFATSIANGFGNVLTKLPWGDTMAGMNVYTSLVVGVTAAGAYLFCVRKLCMPVWVAFVGEVLALSLCWAPSAVLYNYLTYGFLLAGILCLYQGLMQGKNRYMILAGVMLGLNVGVRFSNLVQMGLILVVWYDAFMEKKKPAQVFRETGLCILGYAGTLCAFLSYMACRYGLGEYTEGIRRLFAMTEHAPDYSALSMLEGMVWAYYNSKYWVKWLVLAVVIGFLVCLLLPRTWVWAKRILSILVIVTMQGWLVRRGYCIRDFASYDSIYFPCIFVFEMAIGLSLLQLPFRKVKREYRIQALLVILLLLLSSLGTNNAVYSSMNNLFLALPLFLWMAYRFLREYRHILIFPLQAVLVVGILLLTVQGVEFGIRYVYEEATGARDLSAQVTGVPVLRGMHTSPQRAAQLTGLYAYLEAEDLLGEACILYGYIPGISYYMGLEPAINIWSDLDSYDPAVMLEDLEEVDTRGKEDGTKPLVILEGRYRQYIETGDFAELEQHVIACIKFRYICAYMEQNAYYLDYANEKYAVYRAAR